MAAKRRKRHSPDQKLRDANAMLNARGEGTGTHVHKPNKNEEPHDSSIESPQCRLAAHPTQRNWPHKPGQFALRFPCRQITNSKNL